MQKDKAVNISGKKTRTKKEAHTIKAKSKEDIKPPKKIDEQNSDGSGGAFEEFIDQRRDDE